MELQNYRHLRIRFLIKAREGNAFLFSVELSRKHGRSQWGIEQHAQLYADAGDALVIEARRAIGQELRRIRKKLRLNQIEASELTGGGHNAFSRYETGKVSPATAVVNLFRLLDRHPEAVKELKRA